MLGFDLGKDGERATEASTVLIGAFLWRLPNPVLMLGLLGLLGCASSADHVVFWLLDRCSLACCFPLVRPHELLAGEKLSGESADCCGKIPAGLGRRGIYYFFLLWFPFPSKGENLRISRSRGSLGWTSARWSVVEVIPRPG